MELYQEVFNSNLRCFISRLLRVVCPAWIDSFPRLRVITLSYFPVLWLRKGDLKTLELRTEIMQRLEREQKQAKETVIIYKFIVHIS